MARPLVIIHGVSKGTNEDNLLFAKPYIEGIKTYGRKAGMKDVDFDAFPFLWADDATKVADQIADGVSMLSGNLGKFLKGNFAYDYAVDVLAYAKARESIQERLYGLLASFNFRCVLAGHSQGSIIALDAVIAAQERGEKVCDALVTFGSPAGIDVPGPEMLGFLDRARALEALPEVSPLPWVNFFDRQDLIVSGKLGPVEGNPLEKFPGYQRLGVLDLEVDTGWYLGSHTSYSENELVHAELFDRVFAA